MEWPGLNHVPVGRGHRVQRQPGLEESSGTFDVDAELELTDSTKLSIGRPPGRPFTRKKFAGEALLDSATSDDMPPGAELYGAPLPADDGISNGERAESAYSLSEALC